MRSLLVVVLLICLTIAGCGGGGGGSGSDSVTPVTGPAPAPNSAPVANAGPDQLVITAGTVTLDATGCYDADGDPLAYSWSFVSLPDGSNAALSSATGANPTFTPDFDGSYILRLIVDDGTVSSTEDTVLIYSIADYSLVFLKAPQTFLIRSGDIYQANSSFSLEIKNQSTVPFVCTRAEFYSGVSVLGFTEDPALLGGEQIDTDEVVGLTYTLTENVPVGPFEFRFYLTRPDTNEDFILVHQY